ncbi:MAG: transporter, putative metabolite:H+ symporter [Frankiaceae bacterium]|nr:transporter, putative metabolite:H+ symporter [Frankiaceae bacterium]
MTRLKLDPVHRRLLLLLAVACFSEGFDFALLTVVLPQVRHTFHLTHVHADLWVAALYLGALPALALGRRADRRGRRQVLLFAIVGYTLAAALTAAAPNIETYVACQFVARCFIATQIAVAWTMAAEDLPADRRGFGFGVLALSSALGTGFCAIVEAVVLSPLNASWRWLYLCALPFLLVVAYLHRRLPESARYLRLQDSTHAVQRLSMLTRPPYRRPLALICLTVLLANLTTEATVFAVDFLETGRGLSDSSANLLLVAAGAAALPVLIVAGRMSDRLGRRRVCIAGLLVQATGLLLFFLAARGTVALGLALMLTYIGLFAAWTTGTAFAVEAFPTSLRAGASSAASMAKLLGQASSFALAAALSTITHRSSVTISVLVVGPFTAALIVAFLLPETSRTELTDVAVPEPVGSGEPSVAGLPGRRLG